MHLSTGPKPWSSFVGLVGHDGVTVSKNFARIFPRRLLASEGKNNHRAGEVYGQLTADGLIELKFCDPTFLGFKSEIPNPDFKTMDVIPRDDGRTVFVVTKAVKDP